MKYFIEDVKCGITKTKMCPYPVGGNVIVSIKYNDGETSKWINNVEVDGIPNFFISLSDIFDKLIEEDLEDDDFTDYLNDTEIYEFDGLELGMYDDIFANFSRVCPNTAKFIKALIWVTRCPMESLDYVKEELKGRNIIDVEIDTIDVEESYLEHLTYKECEKKEDEDYNPYDLEKAFGFTKVKFIKR